MRVAWQGPLGTGHGGVAYAGLQLVHALRSRGAQVDCYLAAPAADVPEIVREDPGIGLIRQSPRWDWDHWYSRNPVSAFVTGQAARGVVQQRLVRLLAEEHARRPYDVVYQFSQIELFGIRPLLSALPPIVVHPEVHAAGELAWHWRERRLAARGETPQRRAIVRAMLTARALRQRRDIHLARRVIVPSHVFASHISSDYRFPRDRISVVPNPIDLNRFTPGTSVSANGSGRPVRVLFVSRLAVRKGVELVTELSHRLDDLAGAVRIEVIGNHSLWSDYRALMRDLNPAVATYKGEFANGQLAEAYAGADLLIQPSHYEPFALTVGEALACGVPVVASREVGATEGVDPACCTVFPAGDIDAFEAAVRGAVDRVRGGGREPIAAVARAEAQRLFSADHVADGVLEALTAAARDASPPGTTPGQPPRRSPLRDRGRRTLERRLASVAKRPLRASEPHSQHSGAAPTDGRLRVALLAHDVHNDGGMERACLELLERASDRVDFVVISGHVDPRVRTHVNWRRLPLPARPFPLKFTIFYFLAGLRLLTESVDLVHSVGAVVPNKVDIATVQFCHAGFRAVGPEFALPDSLLRRTNARISRGLALITEKWSYRADRVRLLAPVSTGVEEEVRRLYPGIDAVVTPNGVDHHRFRPEPEVYRRTRLELSVDADECVAVFVGGDWDRKGVGVAIGGLAEAVARGVRLSLWVVGPGDRARFEAQATELGVAEHVRFFGRRSDTERFYQAADVCVMPTLYETFCLAAFEAAACALPVVATPVHGVADLIGDDIAGIRVERTPQAVGAALARLAADRGLRTTLGTSARQRAASFTWSRSVDSVLACYTRVASRSRLQAH